MSASYSCLQVEVRRGEHLESLHDVDVSVCDDQGKSILSYGNPNIRCFPRSATKPIQALALFSSGAHKKWNLTSAEWALACASHHGEPEHIQVVQNWLSRVGLTVSDLECGTHGPYNHKSSENLLRGGKTFSAIHNNCSGKHTGFLCDALALGAPTKGYIQFDHPVQKLVTKMTSEFCGLSLDAEDSAIDGCGIPTFCFPLIKMAQGFAAFSKDSEGRQILSWALENPVLTSGSDQFPTLVMKRLNHQVFVKVGAEGVMGVYFPKEAWGLAVKARDGAARAAEVATAHVLKDLGYLTEADTAFLAPQKTNWAGRSVSVLKARYF